MTESEVWKDVLGYEGQYQVSNIGNVYSVERRDSRGNKCGGFTLKPANVRGYLKVKLHKNGIGENKSVHRIVAEAFIPNPNNYLEINHKDENKANNCVENLEWCTREYNMNHGTRNEKVSKKLSKKVKAGNIETGEVLTFSSTQEVTRKGYQSSSVSEACRGIYCTTGHLYKDHRWSYMEAE